MKTHLWLLGAALLAAPAGAQSGANDFSAAIQTWNDVREQARDLDVLIAARKLGGVHDAALGLRDTVRELRFGWNALPAENRAQADEGIRKLDSLMDDLHESADNNNPRAVAWDQRTLHVLLDQISAAFPGGTLKAVGPIVATSSVRDPFCRMTVDPATAAARVAVGGQMYYFCSPSEAKAFEKNPTPYIALYDELAFGKPKAFTISAAVPGKIVPNQPALIALAVREQGQKALTTKFQWVHEKLMHLIVVSDDLSWFAHEHPELAKDGRFYIRQSFPRDGRYYLYSDFTPADGVNQVLRSEIRVGSGITRAPRRLVPDKNLTKTVDGVAVSLKLSAPLHAGRQALLTYSLSQNGRTARNMTPYLGAMGHMMAISQDGRQAVHTHAVSPGTDPQTGLSVTPDMSTAKGPTQTFKLQLPTGGLYRVWAQFGIDSKTVTVPFTFEVQADSMKNNSKITLAVTGAALAAGAMNATAAPKAPVAQKITIILPDGYKSGAATVKAGQPVALTFKLKSDAGCGNTVSVPAAKWSKELKVGQQATVVYTPKKSGVLNFQCGMAMYKGTVIVR